MSKKKKKSEEGEQEPRRKTPTFLLELPLQVNESQAKRMRAHLEAVRAFYNAVLSEGQRRLRQMRADPAWQAARAIPPSHKRERQAAFSVLREQYGFSEYALHEYAKRTRVSWIAEHLDAVLAQTLATRAYQALNRVCVGQARRVRFKSRGRGLSSLENKRNDTGLRFVLQQPEDGNHGCVIWKDDQLAALIDWKDPVVKHGLGHRIKYARLVQRKASSPNAAGADAQGYRYFVQLALEGLPYHKPGHTVGTDTIGADLGPSTIALVPHQAEASLSLFCEELTPDEKAIRRLQRQMDRQRRAANAENYDSMGRIKKTGSAKLHWKTSRSYEKTRRRKASKERQLAAHRKSLHGEKAREIVAVGNTIIIEKISYKAWQKHYGKSVGLRAPGMFVEQLRRTVASTGGTLVEVCTHRSKLSQYCHGCGQCRKKPLRQRFHQCVCGIGPVQRDLYSAFLAAYLDPVNPIPSCAQYVIRLRRCGGAPAGRTRACPRTCECGAVSAPKHGCAPCQSASARKSKRTHTRASLPPASRKVGSVVGTPEPPRMYAGEHSERGNIADVTTHFFSRQITLPARADNLAALMKGRRSVRKFHTQPIPRELIEQILEAARWAPSPHGRQPWRFVILTKAELKARLAEQMGSTWQQNLQMDGQDPEIVNIRLDKSRQRILKAPVIIIPCLYLEDLDRYPDEKRQSDETTMAIQSLGAAIQNMLLMAYDLGLDTGWMCAPLFCPEIVCEALELDPRLIPHALITVGYASADPQRRERLPLSALIVRYD